MSKKNILGLGERMKQYYESRSQTYLSRRTYHILRVDGRAFHTYTLGFKVPFDDDFIKVMDSTAVYLCKNIQGAKFAFVQSDEISVLITDFDDIATDLWFDGNIQKIVSVSASMATSYFNENIKKLKPDINRLAEFDARVFSIPYNTEVENYFYWRLEDTLRNSVQSLAHSLFSDKELYKKNVVQMKEMCAEKGMRWDDLESGKKFGRIVIKGDVLSVKEKSDNNLIINSMIPYHT